MIVDPTTHPEHTPASMVTGAHVIVSELAGEIDGAEALETAFHNRLGNIDEFPGQLGLHVWKDDRHPGRCRMLTWWESETFKDHMRSDWHRRSHDRVPMDLVRARPAHVNRYSLVAT